MPYIARIFYKFLRGVLRNAPDKRKKEMNELVKETHFVVDREDDLCYYDSCMVIPFTKHSRRGQFYYFLADKETLEVSVFATKADGSGGMVALPDEFIDLIKKGDIVV